MKVSRSKCRLEQLWGKKRNFGKILVWIVILRSFRVQNVIWKIGVSKDAIREAWWQFCNFCVKDWLLG